MDITTYTTEVIPLPELPQWSPWPSRLLGLTPWNTPHRTTAKVAEEYDKDKYARLLAHAKEHAGISPWDVRAFELNIDPAKFACVSHKGSLYRVSQDKIMHMNAALLMETMAPLMQEADIIVELGCGYGYPLWLLHQGFPG